jgi:DNA polymerase-3 subunit beta
MQFKIKKETLLKGIQSVYNIISGKSNLPILSNILLETSHNNLKITATDLDVGITCLINVDIMEGGRITLPAKRFNDIIKELPETNIGIIVKKNNITTIQANNCQFKLTGMPADEFPRIPELKDKEVVCLKQSQLKKMLSLTAFAVSYDETRYILNGILFNIEDDNLTLVATDGRRLALAKHIFTQRVTKDTRFIIPIKTIHEINRNLKDEGDVSIVIGLNQVLFEINNTSIVSRVIEGEFPNYHQVIPKPISQKIKINRERFLWAIRRASLLSTPDYQAVKLEILKNKIVVSKNTPDIGESYEKIDIEYTGKEIVVGFNPSYLIDVLKVLGGEVVEFEVSDAEKPAVIRKNDYVYIILPMRLS